MVPNRIAILELKSSEAADEDAFLISQLTKRGIPELLGCPFVFSVVLFAHSGVS
jgi:hypothetical protein